MVWYTRFLAGLADSLGTVEVFRQVMDHPPLTSIYIKILLLNIGISCGVHLLVQTLFQGMESVVPVSILYIERGIVFFGWSIPAYLVALAYNAVHTNDALTAYVERYNPNNVGLRYGCYGRYSRYVVNKFYYQIVVLLLTLETQLISRVPHVGWILDWILASLVYSYYSWEYSWSSFKIPHSRRYAIFEADWTYHLGFGALLGVIQCRCGFFIGYHVISSIYPLYSMVTLVKFTVPEEEQVPNKTIEKKTKRRRLLLFWLPVRYTDQFVQWLAAKLETRWNKQRKKGARNKEKRREGVEKDVFRYVVESSLPASNILENDSAFHRGK